MKKEMENVNLREGIFKTYILQLLILSLVALPIIPLEIYLFDSSNIEFAIVSGLFMMPFVASFSSELHGKIMMTSALYICYFSHSWTVYGLVAVGLFFLLLSAIIIEKVSVWKKKQQKRAMEEMYPLYSNLLDKKEKDILSSIYGKSGYYYQVIQAGYVTDIELLAINARLKREINK
ncbi:hypothetical protein P7D15_01405 [Bacillus cereus]|uniref:hypothetical protein n=2 Tax=Bacillus cereus TaxID=1396 RepID=UPI00240D3B92|nr:hypothetical protein [Bacillus cereus]MDF9599071.1 hypothetical protein [Bacillus cereus]MDG1589404.1 hypothetical protein [Bacillus cereus]